MDGRIAPANVEIGGAALLALSRQARGADSTKGSNAVKRVSTTASFDRFCLAAGVDALGGMMEKDAEEACGPRHVRSGGRRGHRRGTAGAEPEARLAFMPAR
jgi:hypothetical protein